ncbi:MAG: hypothetical protein RL770_1504, partial [Pseudomonadota bacterium]
MVKACLAPLTSKWSRLKLNLDVQRNPAKGPIAISG